jgi:hypothetical protein
MALNYSDSIARGILSIQGFIDDDLLGRDGLHADDTELGRFLQQVRASIQELRLTDQVLRLRGRAGGAYKLRKFLVALLGAEWAWEYLWALIGLDVLYRLEKHLARLPTLVEVLPDTEPPERARRFMADIVECYLLGLDTQCIVTCRAAVEVLVEDLGADLSDRTLGEAIKALRDDDKISRGQAEDMFAINRQAREMIHDEPSRMPPSADDCVQRVTRLLAQLRPTGWME